MYISRDPSSPWLTTGDSAFPEGMYPLPRTYNIFMLLAAYFIGILGTFTSSQLLVQVSATRRLSRKLGWAALSAFSVGGTAGVGMHWVKVLAAIYPYEPSYRLFWPLVGGTIMVLTSFGVVAWDLLVEAHRVKRGLKFSLEVQRGGRGPNASDEGLPLLPVSPVEREEDEEARRVLRGGTGVERKGEGLRKRATPGPRGSEEGEQVSEREKEKETETETVEKTQQEQAAAALLVHGLYTPDLTPPALGHPPFPGAHIATPTPLPASAAMGQPSSSGESTPRPPTPGAQGGAHILGASHFHAHVHHHYAHHQDYHAPSPSPSSHPHSHSPHLPPLDIHSPLSNTHSTTTPSHPHPHQPVSPRPSTPGSHSASGSSNQAELFLPSSHPHNPTNALDPTSSQSASFRAARIAALPFGSTFLGSAIWDSILSLNTELFIKGCVLALGAYSMHFSALASLHFPSFPEQGITYVYRWRADLLLLSWVAEIITTTGIVLWLDGEANPGKQTWMAVFAPTAASVVHFLTLWSGQIYVSTPPPPLPPRPSADLPSLILTLAVSTYVLSYATLAHQITQSRNRLAETIFTKRRLWKVIAEKEAFARANQQKGEFIAVASHEIRTPLHAILGFADLLLQTNLTEEQSTCLEAIRMGCYSIQLITNNVLDFSKLEHNTRESVAHATPVNMRTLALRIIRSVSAPQRLTEQQLQRLVNYNTAQDQNSPSLHMPDEKHVELFLEVHDAVPEIIKIDEAYITRVVMNLISNGIKFTDDGYVLVKVTVEHPKRSLPSLGPLPRPVLAITVRDSGIGIPNESKNAIFEPFRQVDGSLTRTHTGAGLGLAISKQLVERMGGTIDLRSKPGVGSEFTVRVPAFEGILDKEIPDPLHMPKKAFSFLTVAVAVRSIKTFHLFKELLERRGFLLRPVDLSHPEKELQVSLAKIDRLLVDVESLAGAPWLLDWITRLPHITDPNVPCPASVYVLIDDLSNEVGQQLIRMLSASGQVALIHRPILLHPLMDSLLQGVTLSPPTSVPAPVFRSLVTPLSDAKANAMADSEYEYFPPVFEEYAASTSARTPGREGPLHWEDTVGRILNPLESVVQRARAPSSDKRVRFEGNTQPAIRGSTPSIHLRPPPVDAKAAQAQRVGPPISPSGAPAVPVQAAAPVTIPAAPAPVAPPPAPPEKYILLVEDNVVNQKLGIRLLQKLSHRCDVAENGKIALDMLKLNEDKYYLILMDCQMPVMNGFECTRRIRSLEASGARQGRLPIIALTANVSSESREECARAGADFFLPKPLFLQDLKDTLNQFLAVVA